MSKENKSEYLTASQLAKEAGVTLRTIRFYDQKGILTPAERGTGNVRYYTEKERERLYAILCYKFMGMSLEEIRKKLDDNETPAKIEQTIHEKVAETEKAILKQMQQYAIMKDLEALSSAGETAESWTDYAAVVDYIQAKWDMIWQLNRAIADGMEVTCKPVGGSEEMKQYYQLLADVLHEMNQGVDPESDEMMEIMKRYFEMNPDEALLKVDPDIMSIRTDNASDLWADIKDYMKKASNHYLSNRETKD